MRLGSAKCACWMICVSEIISRDLNSEIVVCNDNLV